MEKTKRDLEAQVASQNEQLVRYEKRLKDVVTAYKGLLKEKEALETSFNAITTKKESPISTNNNDKIETNCDVDGSGLNENPSDVGSESSSTSTDNQLQTQIITLMNSLATLSAEKSRMEASFQADKKHLRFQLNQKDQSISEFQTKIKENEERAKLNVEEIKAKWIIERQEREKETNNQMLMIRELQKLYADERHLKENIEMQLNNFKTQFASNEAENSRLRELQIQLKETKAQLKQLQSNNKQRIDGIEGEELDNALVLKQVQREMQQLKDQHAVAIKNEQRRVLFAEEESKKQIALHEDRVANLEARLAELSSTVGQYDRLRQQDQESIQALKKKLQQLDEVALEKDNDTTQLHRTQSVSIMDVASIVDEIMRLKKLLLIENSRTVHPIDVSKVFAMASDPLQNHQEELNRLQQQFQVGKLENDQLKEQIQVQRSHISTLQEKVKVLNRNIDEQELEIKQHAEKLQQTLKEERTKWKSSFTDFENEHRFKVNELEQQLQKQRQRSLQLLEEKEQEIKTLQTSFEIFHNASLPVTTSTYIAVGEQNIASSDAESVDEGAGSVPNKVLVKPKKLSVGENCHMLHYANEIARKDIEIAGLRKAKISAESALRKSIQEKVNAQEELSDKIGLLEEQVDRLERCKTREGANLEYLKNVIISFIVTKDADGKRHMMNAISAVLQFTPNEIQAINAAFHKK